MKQRKAILAATLLYTCFVLYCMFFAFDRASSEATSYTFIFLPENFLKLPNPSDLLHPTLMDLVSIGNTAAFIPFGILVPLLYPIRFVRFLAGFILSILVIETIQAFTLLGSFDINDVLQNSSGAAIGFGAYALGRRATGMWRKIAVTGLSTVILLIGVWGIGSAIDSVLTKQEGPFVALSELDDSLGHAAKNTKPYHFKIGGQEITPQFNVYSAEGEEAKTYTYKLKNKELYFSMQYGIPDQGNFKGSISVVVDGQQILSNSADIQGHAPNRFEWFFEQADELKITVEGNEKVWDIGYKEMKYFWE
ncbi:MULTISPECIES: VanZ family protein [Paenibacillus]|uniref:VanZ family protein n=1 Tax=Paenibacillus TaxID=44249 RepID=UPI00296EB283|nr:VanZ family protein [Paenibacillus sp. alder61]